MSVKATPRLQWIFAAVLCLCTLVALWATAMRVREQKLAARRGERIQDTIPIRVAENGRPLKLSLISGQKLAVEHFWLLYSDKTLKVSDSQGSLLVSFINLEKGVKRGWQELQLTVLQADPSSLVVDAEIRPGAPSTGDGWYTAIRAGLRVEFDMGRIVTVTAWDPAKPELKAKIEIGEKVEEKTLVDNAETWSFGVKLRLKNRELYLYGD
jgi:hypothetical protein